MQHQQISQVISQAKQQRAEYIGSAIHKHPVATLMAIGLPIVLTQLPWLQSTPVAETLQQLFTSAVAFI